LKMEALAISLSAFLLGAIGAYLVSRYGIKTGLADIPGERSSHRRPTPRGGGAGIIAGMLIAGIVSGGPAAGLAISAAGIMGIAEDIYGIPAKTRLAGLLCVSAAYIIFSSHYSGLGGIVFWALFMTAAANFYNFMDGVDGMAGLSGLVCFSLMAFFALLKGNTPVFMLCISAAAASAGFLPFNWPKARVFMGDGGSLALGFAFGLTVHELSSGLTDFLLLLLFLPMHSDALITLFARWREGEQLMKAHRKHLYQYLANELRLDHWEVSLLYALSQAAVGTAALLLYRGGPFAISMLAASFSLVFIAAYRAIKSSVGLKEKSERSVLC